MEPVTINATDLRTKTRDLMERVKFNGERFIVKTFGRPMAVISSFDDFMLIQDTLADLHSSRAGNPAPQREVRSTSDPSEVHAGTKSHKTGI